MSRQEDFKQMAKTLAQLHRECERIGRQVTSADLSLKMYGKNCEVGLKLNGDNGNYWVEVRPSIEQDEQLAIIMQMFGAGNDASIAIAVANQIKQGVIDKACEHIGNYLGMALSCYPIDIDVLVKDKFVSKFVDCIRKAMEE